MAIVWNVAANSFLLIILRLLPQAGIRLKPFECAFCGLFPYFPSQVGEELRVVFINRLPAPASIHVHGVFYDKASEGELL